MLQALRQTLTSLDIDDAKARFAAWWDGYDYMPVPDAPEQSDPSHAADSSKPAPAGPQTNDATQAYRTKTPMLAAHLTIAQQLWGDGFIGPGDRDFILDLVNQVAVSKEKSVAYVGLGLGGPAREIAKEFGVWISGYEAREDLATIATEQSTMAGLARKVSAEVFDPSADELPEAKFDIILARDEFFLFPDKKRVLTEITKALKPGGSMLCTDYVLKEEAARADVEAKAFSPVWGMPDLWAPQDYRDALTELELDLRVHEDITPTYIDLLTDSASCWGEIMAKTQAPGDPNIDNSMVLKALGTEAAVWAERLQAFKSGQLGVFRFLALKARDGVR